MKFIIFLTIIFSQNLKANECIRVKVYPSSLCANLKATLDNSLCTGVPTVKNARIECKSEFLADLIYESENQIFHVPMSKSADGTWAAGAPVGEMTIRAVENTTNKAEPRDTSFKFWAEFRTRFESDKETNLISSRSPSYLRLRPGIEWRAQPKLSLVAEGQGTKEFGAEAYPGVSTTANSRTRTSGETYDKEFSLHQAYIKYFPLENFDFRVGRSVLFYGDQLLIGKSDWNNVGRSFDMGSLSWKNPLGWVEVFHAKIVDRSISSDRPGNEDLSGLYIHSDFGEGLSNIDPYVFNYQDSTNLDSAGNTTTTRMNEIWSYGLRVKSKFADLDYRGEATKQAGGVSASQIDAEIGWSFWGSRRFAIRYFDVDEDFNQLFPSSHRWLGAADIFSRRNIKGYELSLDTKVSEDLRVETSYYWLQRHSETKAGYQFNGTAMSTTSRSPDLGRELDIELIWKIEKELELLLGYADFYPGDYIRDQYANIDPVKTYLQLTAQF